MSSTEAWMPFYARASEKGISEFECLFPGVPNWMRESLWVWLRKRLVRWVYSQRSTDGGYADPEIAKIREVERICRIDSKWDGLGRTYTERLRGLEFLRAALYADDTAFLTAVDFHLSSTTDAAMVKELEATLEESSSKWRVGKIGSRNGLVERVDETVQRAADDLIRRNERPGRLLAEGWKHAFSMQRNPSSAYRCAVRAVESAAASILIPADPQPSLGKMITAFRDGMDKWQFTFTVDSKINPKSVLMQMMQLLWTNDYARHIDADPMAPLNVSQAEAESAVVLALTLTNWFVSGAVTRI